MLATELNTQNKIKAINMIAVPLIIYNYGIIDWLNKEIRSIDHKTRKLLISGKIHHPNDDVDRLYMKRNENGRNRKFNY